MSIAKKDVLEALKKISDPELGFNIVDLGYINEIFVKNGKVKILIVFTTPFCPYAGLIFQQVEEAIKKIKGVKEVEIEYDWNNPWSPEKMKPEIKKKLGL